MDEQNLNPEMDPVSEESNTEAENKEDIIEAPKKRIVRRKLRSSPKPTEEPVLPYAGKNEINEVLTNLYGPNDDDQSDVKEITVKKSNSFFTLVTALGFLVFIAAVVWAGFIYMPASKSGGNADVTLEINGPTQLSLGATTTYTLSYSNRSNSTLNKVVLNAYYPEGFVYSSSSEVPSNAGHNEWNLKSLAPYQKGSLTVTGLNFGSLNEQKSWRVFLNYEPTNFNSELQKAATLTTVISNSPIQLTISGPDQVSLGTDATYAFALQKDPSWKSQLTVSPMVPTNFSISSSSPKLDKNNQWTIAAKSTSTPGTFKLTGKFVSNSDQPSPIRGQVFMPASGGDNYQIASAQLTSQLIKNDVSASLAINGAVTDFDSHPGDTLNMTVRVKNQSATDISNATVKLVLTAPSQSKVSLLKWSDLVDKNQNTILGEQIDDYTRRGTISWDSSQVPALAKIKSGSEVSFDIQLPIKDAKSFDLATIKNPIITATLSAKFKDSTKTTQNATTKPITITLDSDLTFSNDDAVSNAGLDGEKHLVNWVLNNNFHPLKNIKLTATTYGDVTFTMLSKAAGELTYDQNQNLITWIIPEMPDGTDVLNSSFSITLNKHNPTQTLLLSKVHLTAEDSVTGKTIDLAGEEISLVNPQN
jgi:uncharacterized repeat protein (TIGR01451 family)